MDDRSKKVIAQEPAEIRNEMRHTRAAITNKLEMLEDHVTEKVEDIQHKVEETVCKVKDSVHDTVQTVKNTVDWRHQMNEHPWAMFGGAVLAGFMVSRVMSGEPRSRVLEASRAVPGGRSHGESAAFDRAAGNGGDPTLLDKAKGQLNAQVDRLERAALSAASDFLERVITHAVPGLAGHLHHGTGV